MHFEVYNNFKNYAFKKGVGIDQCFKKVRKQNVDHPSASIG